MSETINLKDIKTKIYRIVLEDGLLEIMLGIYLIMSGIFLTNRTMILNFLWLPVALVLIEVIRKRFVYPRAGYAKISLSTREIITILCIILIGVAILSALIAIAAANMGYSIQGNWQEIISYALILFLVIAFCFIAYRFKIPRWYMHGISIGVVFLLSKVFDVHELVVILGIWITLVGGIVFARYMKKFPNMPHHHPSDKPQANGGEEISEVSNAG